MTNWLNNDELFRKLVAEGHFWERYVANELRNLGLEVVEPEQTVRKHASEALRGDYADSVDLIVEGLNCEVKSRRIKKWHDPLNLCSERAWKRQGETTDIWVCISQMTREMICVSGEKARRYAEVATVSDRVRGIKAYKIRQLALQHWSPMEKMAKALIAKR